MVNVDSKDLCFPLSDDLNKRLLNKLRRLGIDSSILDRFSVEMRTALLAKLKSDDSDIIDMLLTFLSDESNLKRVESLSPNLKGKLIGNMNDQSFKILTSKDFLYILSKNSRFAVRLSDFLKDTSQLERFKSYIDSFVESLQVDSYYDIPDALKAVREDRVIVITESGERIYFQRVNDAFIDISVLIENSKIGRGSVVYTTGDFLISITNSNLGDNCVVKDTSIDSSYIGDGSYLISRSDKPESINNMNLQSNSVMIGYKISREIMSFKRLVLIKTSRPEEILLKLKDYDIDNETGIIVIYNYKHNRSFPILMYLKDGAIVDARAKLIDSKIGRLALIFSSNPESIHIDISNSTIGSGAIIDNVSISSSEIGDGSFIAGSSALDVSIYKSKIGSNSKILYIKLDECFIGNNVKLIGYSDQDLKLSNLFVKDGYEFYVMRSTSVELKKGMLLYLTALSLLLILI
ncbi:MAG: hypothetical protein ARM1_0570 [Candidatus Micrarchaeota archaeon]|nr:MAG: hypothetical protein ARM1_0570 [Candidatus Micrarchaeota archaeon]